MSAKITYLFGAGASCNALPLVRNMDANLMYFISSYKENTLNISRKTYFGTKELDFSTIRDTFITDITYLLNKVRLHYSIDTYAKKLFISGTEKILEYRKLKNLFTCYFIAEQLKKNVDFRYDSFLASLISKKNQIDKIVLPENLKIISWNYDFQFEKAYSEYFVGPKDIKSIKESLNVFPRITIDPTEYVNKFGVFKLNGTAEWSELNFKTQISDVLHKNSGFNYEQLYLNEKINDQDIYTIITIIYTFLTELSHSFGTMINFAWEGNDVINLAKLATAETEILVVLGYSFPYFNREVDRDIIRNMAQLRKIYYQAESEQSCEIIRTRSKAIFENLNSFESELVIDPEQFFLPH